MVVRHLISHYNFETVEGSMNDQPCFPTLWTKTLVLQRREQVSLLSCEGPDAKVKSTVSTLHATLTKRSYIFAPQAGLDTSVLHPYFEPASSLGEYHRNGTLTSTATSSVCQDDHNCYAFRHTICTTAIPTPPG